MFKILSSLSSFKPKSLLDIGANQGNFALAFRKYVPSVKLFFLIEANKNCEKALKKLPFDFEICLLSSSEEEKNFYINPDNDMCTGNSYYIENTRHFKKNKFETIKSTTLDKVIIKKNLNFDLIKLDTQGSELDILKGGCEVLKNIEYIIIECNSNKNSYNEGAPGEKEICNFLLSKGFKYKLLIEEHLWFDTKHPTFKYGDVFQKDYLFTRKRIRKSTYLKLNYILNFLKKLYIQFKREFFLK